jgi:hypothetical protein
MTRLRSLAEPDHLPALDLSFAHRRPALGIDPATDLSSIATAPQATTL